MGALPFLLGAGAPSVAAQSGAAGRVKPSDTAVFSAVIQALTRTARPPLVVDPHPLIAHERVDAVREDTRARVPKSYVTARENILHSLGVPTTDLLKRPPCGSAFTRPPVFDSATTAAAHQGCPVEVTTVVALGLSRPVPKSRVVNHLRLTLPVPPGSRLVRVIMRTETPSGSSTTVYDWLMKPLGRTWAPVRRIALFDID